MWDTLKTFNDSLALVMVAAIFGLWVVQGLGLITLPGEVVGATIAGLTLILQFYFRKRPSENGD